MAKRMLLVILLLGVLLVGTTADAQETENIVVVNVWARPTAVRMEGMTMPEATAEPMGNMGEATAEPMNMGGEHSMSDAVSAAYMQITNQTDQTIRLVSASSLVSARTEVHEVSMVNNVMQMHPVEGGIEILAGDTVALQPGGYHVMLMELQQDLYTGDALAVTLTFELADGTTQEITVGAAIQDEPPAESPIEIANAWARPTAVKMDGMEGGMGNMGEATAEPMAMGSSAVSAAYMLIENSGDTADRLVAARTVVAGLVEIHEVNIVDNVMRMHPVEGGIDIPVGGTVALQPGGYHVMLMNLQQDLYTGEAFGLTLVFESGLEITVGVPITEPQ
ncbi:MAG: copper chaperone PCu(A)C [Anaerolineaceae bacterium]|nr:copper chaperone PCu(A)C [Anaerolineaceae bacterium]